MIQILTYILLSVDMYVSTLIYPGYITNDSRRIHTAKPQGTMADAS